MKLLVCIVHFFGQNASFSGGSSWRGDGQDAENAERRLRRETFLRRTWESADAIRSLGFDVDIKVCGIEGKSLMPVDWDFSRLEDPTFLVYETLAEMAKAGTDYDYAMCMEDDILLPLQTFENVVRFEPHSAATEILHPNRLEQADDGTLDCVDLRVVPGWKGEEREILGRTFSQALNPHSGIAIFSRRKLKLAAEKVDFSERNIVWGGRMASAFANIHKPFELWRCKDDMIFHHVIHQDKWVQPHHPWHKRAQRRIRSTLRSAKSRFF